MIAYVIGADEAERLGSMAVYFLLAVVIVAPYAIVRLRRVLRDRRERQAAADGAPSTSDAGSTPAASSVADASSESADPLAAAVATIDAAMGAGDEVVEVRVPIEAPLGRRSVPGDVADLLLGDALRRSGFVVEEERIEKGERVLRCRRTDRGT